tara:strand:- start:4309 stop:4500 length:192 start_codon:yes stop_codon:yes gene_type:complete
MNTQIFRFLFASAVLLAAVSVEAHDPSEHAGSAGMPDCSAMHNSGSDKTDMNDPVMQAMMKNV